MRNRLCGLIAALMLATTPAVASQPEEAIHETKETDDEVNLTQSSVTAKNVARIVGGDHPSMYDRFSLTGTAGLTTPADQFTLYLTLGASAGGINGEDHHLKIPQNPGRYVGPITGVEFHFQGPLGTKQETEVKPLARKEMLLLNIQSQTTVGIVIDPSKKNTTIDLKLPIAANPGDRITISRKIGDRFRLIGFGILK